MKRKIAIIGTAGLPAKHSGFETLAEQLITHLSNQYDFTVYCSKNKYSEKNRLKNYKDAKLEYTSFDTKGIQGIFYNTISIFKALRKNDVLLILGITGAWTLPFIKLFTNKKIIVSIDTIEWKKDKWSLFAKLYLWWAEKIAIQFSHIDITDNESIQDYTAMRYQTLSRVIEYGADHTLRVRPIPLDYIKYPFLSQQYAVKVCRIEPENNVHLVLQAFQKSPNFTIVVIGNWENSLYGKTLKNKYQNTANIILLDTINNQRELNLIRSNAALYIHGNSAGGTNLSLVEAMYLGLPVFSFNVSYNKTTTENKAIYFSSADKLLIKLSSTSQKKLRKIGNKMQQIATKRYTWKLITNKYNLIIEEVMIAKRKNTVIGEFQRLDKNFIENNQLAHLQNSAFFYEKNK